MENIEKDFINFVDKNTQRIKDNLFITNRDYAGYSLDFNDVKYALILHFCGEHPVNPKSRVFSDNKLIDERIYDFMDSRWERIFIKDTYTEQSEYIRLDRNLVKNLLKDVVDDFNNIKDENVLNFFKTYGKNFYIDYSYYYKKITLYFKDIDGKQDIIKICDFEFYKKPYATEYSEYLSVKETIKQNHILEEILNSCERVKYDEIQNNQ